MMGNEYSRVHHAARKRVAAVCERCGQTGKVHAALRAGVPPERLKRDDLSGSSYSLDPADYHPLCIRCHRRLDLVEGRPRCRKGHDYTPENTRYRPDGSRCCRTCHREQMRAYLADPVKRAAKNE